MTPNFWLSVSQTVVFLAVCGFAWWVSRLIVEAASNSALAAREAAEAAQDAQRTATDIREMREMLRTWVDQQQAQVSRVDERRPQDAPSSPRPIRTDTAESHVVLTPQAIIGRGSGLPPGDSSLGDGLRPRRGRHASDPDPGWTSVLAAVASRTASRIKSPDADRRGGVPPAE